MLCVIKIEDTITKMDPAEDKFPSIMPNERE